MGKPSSKKKSYRYAFIASFVTIVIILLVILIPSYSQYKSILETADYQSLAEKTDLTVLRRYPLGDYATAPLLNLEKETVITELTSPSTYDTILETIMDLHIVKTNKAQLSNQSSDHATITLHGNARTFRIEITDLSAGIPQSLSDADIPAGERVHVFVYDYSR